MSTTISFRKFVLLFSVATLTALTATGCAPILVGGAPACMSGDVCFTAGATLLDNDESRSFYRPRKIEFAPVGEFHYSSAHKQRARCVRQFVDENRHCHSGIVRSFGAHN